VIYMTLNFTKGYAVGSSQPVQLNAQFLNNGSLELAGGVSTTLSVRVILKQKG